MELSKTFIGDFFVMIGAFLNFITPSPVTHLRNKFRIFDVALFDAILVLIGSYYYTFSLSFPSSLPLLIFYFTYNCCFFVVLGIFAHVIFGVNTGLNSKLNLNRREYSSTNPNYTKIEYPSWKRYGD